MKVLITLISIITLFISFSFFTVPSFSQSSEEFEYQVNMNPAAECVSGEYEVVGRTIYRCDNGRSIKVESCATGVTYENDVPKCLKLTSEVGGGFQEEIPSLLSLNYSTLITWIVIGVVGIVLGFIVTYHILKKIRLKSK